MSYGEEAVSLLDLRKEGTGPNSANSKKNQKIKETKKTQTNKQTKALTIRQEEKGKYGEQVNFTKFYLPSDSENFVQHQMDTRPILLKHTVHSLSMKRFTFTPAMAPYIWRK